MKNLKSRFGKFAASNQQMTMINGGYRIGEWCCGADLCRNTESTADHVCGLAGRGKSTQVMKPAD